MAIKIKATSPCMKFINATPDKQAAKLLEEVAEVCTAWANFEENKTRENLKKLFMELIDVKACVNTAIEQINRAAQKAEADDMNHLGYKALYHEAKECVVKKNLLRGYYREESHE